MATSTGQAVDIQAVAAIVNWIVLATKKRRYTADFWILMRQNTGSPGSPNA